MDPVTQFSAATAVMRGLLASVGDEHLDLPTPCDGWSVRDLTDHVIANQLNSFAHWAGVDRHHEPISSSAELADRYDSATQTVLQAYTAPGTLTKTLVTPLGEVPGAALLAVCFADQLTHVWDLARALGREVDVPDQLAEDATEVWRGFLQAAHRDGETFAAAVPTASDASPLDRLAAFTGRPV